MWKNVLLKLYRNFTRIWLINAYEVVKINLYVPILQESVNAAKRVLWLTADLEEGYQEEVDDMEKNSKRKMLWESCIGGILFFILVVSAVICYFAYRSGKDWPARYRSMFDDFFGEGEWEVVNEETKKESLPTTVSSIDGNVTIHYTYTEWDISVSDSDGKEREYTISNHTYLINQRSSKKKYTAKQALIQQLMFVSQERAGEEVKREILENYLTEAEIECLAVDILWRDGNPPTSVYDKLVKEGWFTCHATAEDWLKTELFEFYLRSHAYTYKAE